MSSYTRREIARKAFGGMTLLLSKPAGNLLGAAGLDEALRTAVQRHKVPGAMAMVATAEKTLYAGGVGKRDAASETALTTTSIFRIASMTKAVTSAAALQLVESGKLQLDEPVAKHLPELGKLEVLEGFDPGTGKPLLRPARQPVTLRRLLTHTAGFAYDTWDGNLLKYMAQAGPAAPSTSPPVTPLVFEPGTRWEYGTNLDWTGHLVEVISGQTLEAYFERHIFQLLGMRDTGFRVPAEKFDRLVSFYQRQGEGVLKEEPRTLPVPLPFFNGGGGLYSTASDYLRFTQMILRRGRASGKEQILRPKTVEMMASNQIGGLSAGRLQSFRPERSRDVDFHPGFNDKFGFGFLINTTAYESGRSAGSLAWAGLQNTFYWIDPRRGICAVLLMQFLPFCDAAALGVLRDFERAVYATFPAA
jgi:methyl acetate hydrolase